MGWPSRAFGVIPRKPPKLPSGLLVEPNSQVQGDVRIVGGSQEISSRSLLTGHLTWTLGGHLGMTPDHSPQAVRICLQQRSSHRVWDQPGVPDPRASSDLRKRSVVPVLYHRAPNSGSRAAPMITGSMCLPKICMRSLTPSTSECGYTWRYGL